MSRVGYFPLFCLVFAVFFASPGRAALTEEARQTLCQAFQYYATDYSATLANLAGPQTQARHIPVRVDGPTQAASISLNPQTSSSSITTYRVIAPLTSLSDADALDIRRGMERAWNQEGERIEAMLNAFCIAPEAIELVQLFVSCFLETIRLNHPSIPPEALLGPHLSPATSLHLPTAAHAVRQTVAGHRADILTTLPGTALPGRALSRQPISQLPAMESRLQSLEAFLERLAGGNPCGGAPALVSDFGRFTVVPEEIPLGRPTGSRDRRFVLLARELILAQNAQLPRLPSSNSSTFRALGLLSGTAVLGGLARYVLPRLVSAGAGVAGSSNPAGWIVGGCVVLAGTLASSSSAAAETPRAFPLAQHWTRVMRRLEHQRGNPRACPSARDIWSRTLCDPTFAGDLLATMAQEARNQHEPFPASEWAHWIELEQRRICRPAPASTYPEWIQSGQVGPWLRSAVR